MSFYVARDYHVEVSYSRFVFVCDQYKKVARRKVQKIRKEKYALYNFELLVDFVEYLLFGFNCASIGLSTNQFILLYVF